ncbi:GNVR domain-containing protein [Hyphomicrobium sp.]|uniref:GNVR domain-containing protein n=1 Tax=Hyphomicrobium sp. TaxID=82 RepID=UPI002C9BE9CA|nr:GNVR domain-containing protein [Hyphomicrobium sp.]HVZ05652.1 GNVR domain-containing protein [Hyphomicrobium sp.]
MVHRKSAEPTIGLAHAPSVFLEALKWRKGIVLAWCALGLAVSAAMLLSVQPRYIATAELQLGVSSVGARTESAPLVESQIAILKSGRLAKSVIDKRDLWKDAELACRARGLLQRILSLPGSSCSVPRGTAVDRDTILANFQNDTSVVRAGRSFVADVSFISDDPKKAAAVANALAAAYVAYQSEVETRDVEQAGTRLADHLAELREKSGAASAAVDKLKGNRAARQVPSSDQVRALESKSQAYQGIYQTLLDRYARSVGEQASPVTEARIISEAEPPSHWSEPDIPLVLLLGAGAGLLVGVAVAMRKEHVARPVRSLEQIERDIGVRALGIVPLVQGRRLLPALHQAPPLLLHDRGDALRGVKIAVNELCARDTPETTVIGVVSAYQGEGKSTVAFNLAVLEVESRRRVLLVDANLHRPSLGLSLPHGTLLPPLEGRAALSDMVTRSELGFDFLGECSGEPSIHPADLLGSRAMRDLIRSARDHYDCVVCDLPNVLGHADVQAAADIFDALIMVTEWGRTPSAAAMRAALKSTVISDRLVGVIINKAPLGQSAIA